MELIESMILPDWRRIDFVYADTSVIDHMVQYVNARSFSSDGVKGSFLPITRRGMLARVARNDVYAAFIDRRLAGFGSWRIYNGTAEWCTWATMEEYSGLRIGRNLLHIGLRDAARKGYIRDMQVISTTKPGSKAHRALREFQFADIGKPTGKIEEVCRDCLLYYNGN